MLHTSNRNFYVGIHKKNGKYCGHTVSSTQPTKVDAISLQTHSQEVETLEAKDTLNFGNAFKSFTSVMESYRKFIPLTINIAPILSIAMAEKTIVSFAETKGTKKDDISNEEMDVYELDLNCYRQFKQKFDEISSSLEGNKHLLEAIVIGLVSVYDAFLSKLLRVSLTLHPEIVFTSDKTIKFSDLIRFPSIEDARSSLIDREIEAIIRLSHHEQFASIEKLFNLKLREDLLVWPIFIELCERRNLLTHTGGTVSEQYLANCKTQAVNTSGVAIGTKLNVDNAYFSEAVRTIYEIGVKLCYVLWCKLAKEEVDEASNAINNLAYDLIVWGEYKVAESLLLFSTEAIKKNRGSDQTRRMMVVNLANTIKLQGKVEDAKKILEMEDWSASNDTFAVSVAAVSGNIDRVVQLMKKIGNHASEYGGTIECHPNAEDYRTWPVFKDLCTNENFVTAFETIFNQPLILEKSTNINPNSPVMEHENSSDTISLNPEE